MPDLSVPPRHYSDDEVARLLRRATELQAQARPAVPAIGLTLSELEEIAAEAGIDVGLLRQAADELEAGPSASRPSRAFFGAPLKIVLERRLPFEADASRFDQLLPIIQAGIDRNGNAHQIGRTLTWADGDAPGTRSCQVTISVAQGRTTVRIEERFGPLAAGLFGGVMGGVGGGVGFGLLGLLLAVFGLTPAVIAFPPTVVGLSYAGVRTGFRAKVRARERVLDRLLRALVAALTEANAGAKTP